MSWVNRPGAPPEQTFQELEKQFGIQNIVDIPIEDTFPKAGPENTSIHFVLDSGVFYLVVLAQGNRYRTALASF